MNAHLNVFKSYSNIDRTHQLENDLTRALAISLQEDPLFFHEVLKKVFEDTNFYNQLFESSESEPDVEIHIQQKSSNIPDFEHIFAISLSESPMSNFWEQTHTQEYDPICDLVIRIKDVVLVFEVKRSAVDCTAQLYNQIYNIFNNRNQSIVSNVDEKVKITPFDLNWPKLMTIATKVLNFERIVNSQNRFLSDFISMIRQHNFRWLPEPSISALVSTNSREILRRIESAIDEIASSTQISKLNYNDRIGLEFHKPWAKELLYSVDKEGNLGVSIYPGNTKSQGYQLFRSTPKFSPTLNILGIDYDVEYNYHVKFTSFQRFFQGLWFSEDMLKTPLYTSDNFHKYTGRKKRGEQWQQIEELFERSLNYDWRRQCNWQDAILNSRKTQFDMSFGYEVHMKIPFERLKELDQKQSDLTELVKLILEIYEKFNDKLLIEADGI